MGNFKFTEMELEGLYVVEPTRFSDNRGYFMETYNKRDFDKAGLEYDFVQDNQSKSVKGVLRGLHFQTRRPQAKLVRVLEGEVFDVAVDIRRGSSTYGRWAGVILSEENCRQFMIPRGFAHGFLVLSETATFAYKCDDYYDPQGEGGIAWNDPDIGIEWPLEGEPTLSEKDSRHRTLRESGVVL